MSDRIEDILSLAADMESCIPARDSLTDFIDGFADDELAETDLSFVTAAASRPSFEAFRKRFQLDSK
jgi:hypothetical protein